MYSKAGDCDIACIPRQSGVTGYGCETGDGDAAGVAFPGGGYILWVLCYCDLSSQPLTMFSFRIALPLISGGRVAKTWDISCGL